MNHGRVELRQERMGESGGGGEGKLFPYFSLIFKVIRYLVSSQKMLPLALCSCFNFVVENAC